MSAQLLLLHGALADVGEKYIHLQSSISSWSWLPLYEDNLVEGQPIKIPNYGGRGEEEPRG